MKKMFLILIVSCLFNSTVASAKPRKIPSYKNDFYLVAVYEKGALIDENGEEFKIDLPLKNNTVVKVLFNGRGTDSRHDDTIKKIELLL